MIYIKVMYPEGCPNLVGYPYGFKPNSIREDLEFGGNSEDLV
jgi:hypothetical protein